LVGIMIGWMFFVMALASFTGPAAGGGNTPTTLGQGVTVTPAAGWVSAQSVWNVGPGAISLQRAGVLAAFGADSYSGTTQQLLDEQVSSVRAQFGSFRSLPAASTTIAGGVPALKVLFSGTASSSELEGELVVGTSAGTGVVMLAVAPLGQMAQVQPDLDAMLNSVAIPR
jgi:hypothetical protein